MKTNVTINGAESKLRSFFQGVEGDYVSIQTIFRNENRDLEAQKDKNWFYNYSSILKKYGLAYPLKGVKNHTSMTLGLTLTDKGRNALGNKIALGPPKNIPSSESKAKGEVTLATWRRDAYALQEMHPELVIEFDVRMRKESE